VATDICSHTQVLDEWSSVLVPPSAQGLALGLRSLLDDGPTRHQAIEGALALQTNYGIERYVGEVARAYAQVGGGETDAAFIDRAAARIRDAAARDRTDLHSRRFLGGLIDQVPDATVTALAGPAARGLAPLRADSETDNEKEAS